MGINNIVFNLPLRHFQNLPINQQISFLLNKFYKQHLIEKGYLSPKATGGKIINENKFNQLIAEAISRSFTPGQEKEQYLKRIVIYILQKLGYPGLSLPAGIPKAAHDTSVRLIPYGNYGDNRIAYMRMTGTPTDGKGNAIPYALPLGGLGTGGITFWPAGGFPTVDFINPGRNIFDPKGNAASQFHVYFKNSRGVVSRTLNTMAPEGKLSGWKWGVNAEKTTFHSLYPLSWHVYREFPVRLTIRSSSPIIPGNHKESSLPVLMFNVQMNNTSKENVESSVMLSFQNLVGWANTNENTWDPKAYREVTLPGINSIFPESGQPAGSARSKMLQTQFLPNNLGNFNRIVEDQNYFYLIFDGEPANHQQ
ncbi:MAG: hypothetical protein FD145_278 [Candidatus Saganbacteria bacterium]|uniref:Glycosyl-hydrolase family 116 N-terminal domain-containing protein n=1 Tax=Candidatus Saganbacteria bacterium TaxID=2575572 RepID=A0A833L4Y8_UNCSA|nr:MAG: hypothetical protein FD145_278 [Candidatus Saganbacteria bacterium]